MLDALSRFFFGDQRRKYVVLVFGFVCAQIAVTIYLQTRGVVATLEDTETLVKRTHATLISIELSKPNDGVEIADFRTTVTGTVKLRRDGSDPSAVQDDVAAELIRRGLEVVAVAQPTTTGDWWVQPPLMVDAEGRFHGIAYIGTQEYGAGQYFEIGVIIVPQNGAREGLRVRDLPIAYASSDIVRVYRRK